MHSLLLLLISLRHRPNMSHTLDAPPLEVTKTLIGQRLWGKSNKFLTRRNENNFKGIDFFSAGGVV